MPTPALAPVDPTDLVVPAPGGDDYVEPLDETQ